MKRITAFLTIVLVVFSSLTWRDVAGRMHNWPAWWKILIAVLFSAFCGFAMLYSLDLWADFLLL